MLTRDDRQTLCVDNWVSNKLKGTIEAATGFGKTRICLLAIKRFIIKNPSKNVIIVVPNEPVKDQWTSQLVEWKLFQYCEVLTMNKASTIKQKCSLLIIDEVHKVLADSLIKVFSNIKYSTILCVTATLERLDGKHEILLKHAPLVDKVTLDECLKNNWLSDYREYLVLIDPEDIQDYKNINQEFYNYFSFFDYQFDVAMKCATDWKYRNTFAKCLPGEFKDNTKLVLVNAMGFSRTLQARKKYINYHIKKLELTNLILQHRMDRKCITFSSNVAMAEKIEYGNVYSGKDSKKKGRIKLADFVESDSGVLNTIMKVNEGFDDPTISVAIILGLNSSKTVKKQRMGRAVRYKEGKKVEIFTLVLKGTVEETWYKNSSTSSYITIGEDQLLNVLKGQEFTTKKTKSSQLKLRW